MAIVSKDTDLKVVALLFCSGFQGAHTTHSVEVRVCVWCSLCCTHGNDLESLRVRVYWLEKCLSRFERYDRGFVL